MGFFGSIGKAISDSFGSLGAPKQTPNTKPNGGDGVQAYGGFLASDESRGALVGQAKWVTYANATNTAIVATGLRRTLDMLAGTEWYAKPNPAGGADADRAVEIVTKGLINAQMSKPWPSVVRKAALYKYFGFSLHEWTTKKDSDGMVVFADLAHRPQYTIDRWDKPSEQMPWQAVGQLTKHGNRFVIPRERLFHCVDDMLTDSPDGVGLLRHVIELVRRLGILEGLEGLAYETDLRGMPIGRAPLGELAALAPGGTDSDKQAFIQQKTHVLRSALQGIIKSPDKLQHLLLDSATYQGASPDTITSIQKWAFELLKGESSGVDAVAGAIGRINLEIARVLSIEFALVGGEGSAGTYGMHSDKTAQFATNLQTILTEIAGFATNDLARTLVGLNGLDPDTCTPTLVAKPISVAAVMDTCQALATLAQAGLQPDDEAIGVLRARMQLPEAPSVTPQAAGMIGTGDASRFGAPPGPPRGQPPAGAPGEPRMLGMPPSVAEPQGGAATAPKPPMLGPQSGGAAKRAR